MKKEGAMFESIKKRVRDNRVPLMAFGLIVVSVGGAYFAGYTVASMQTLQLWRGTNVDYELIKTFLEKHGLLEEFNAILLKRASEEGSLRLLLGKPVIKILESTP
jgi:hypothetical protein